MRSSLLIVVALCCAASLPHCMRVTDGIEVDVAYQPAWATGCASSAR
ncbi:MAG: hypothetical protein JRE19_16730 [Deltaproteobacteria bacterium]|nr:hypothetical protein [Deltaproteobacteria bacterium]